MADFTVYDATTHRAHLVKGSTTFAPGGSLSGLNDQTSTDNLIVTTRTPDVCILTGSGNDTINAAGASGRVAIDAGAGINFITGGSGVNVFTAEAAATATSDTVANFHAGDCFTLNCASNAAGLDWFATPKGMMVKSGSVSVTFLGVISQADLTVAIGHGGSQFNIGMVHA